MVGQLVNLEDALALHRLFGLHEEVLAKTHRPPTTHLGNDVDVLVHESVDLGHGSGRWDLFACKDGGHGFSTGAEALLLLVLNSNEGGDGLEEIPQGREVAAFALGDVCLDAIGSSMRVRLQGEVVVRDLLVIALDGLEELVSSGLDALGDLDEKRLLRSSQMLTGAVSLGVFGMHVHHSSQAHEERLGLLEVGGNSVGEYREACTEVLLRAREGPM